MSAEDLTVSACGLAGAFVVGVAVWVFMARAVRALFSAASS